MPSFHHDIIVELFRSRGEIAAELLQTCGVAVAHARVELGSVDLSQVAPAEYRADVVVILRDGDDRAVTGVIVEVQRHVDPHKRLSWPVYVTQLRATLKCPVVLLVVTPEAGVATWARESIHLGGPASYVTPVVLGFDDMPWIRDHTEAQRLPEEGREEGLRQAVLALARIKLEVVTDHDVAALEATHDHGVLNELVTGLGRAATGAEARDVLARLLGYSNSRP